ncbi:DUF1656 domain-containing protein [Paraburkholderia tropica]|uniref:DUF1656 domain-containing protein n=1 Tax=Paraburkholderia tropica TaxID=92647 RepID=UPI002ABD1F02|nr:DUF1656 domain-containing protein [Paraburkholderia tropica]
MSGEVSVGGVYFPTLVFIGIIDLVIFSFFSSLMSIFGIYRFFAHRPLVDVAILVVLMGILVEFSSHLKAAML